MNLKTILTLAVVCAASSVTLAQTYTGTLSCSQSLSAAARPGFELPAELIVKNGMARMKRSSDKYEEVLEGRLSGQQLSLEGQGKNFVGGDPWTTKLQGTIDGRTFKGKGEILTSKGERYRDCQVSMVNTAKPVEQAAPTPQPAPAAQKPATENPILASFDCQKAASKTEKMICSSPQTAKLDVALSNAYRKTLAASDNQNDVKSEQMAWLSTVRNRCESTDCLDSAYAARIKAIEERGASPMPIAPVATPTTEPQAPAAPKTEEPKPSTQESVATQPKAEAPVAEAKPIEKPASTGLSSDNKRTLALTGVIAAAALLAILTVGFAIYWFRVKYPKLKAKKEANRKAKQSPSASVKSMPTDKRVKEAALATNSVAAAATLTTKASNTATVSGEPPATYQVKITGYKTNESPELVSQRLQALLKANSTQVEQLLAMPEYVLKKGLTHEQAQTYQKAILNAGANCVAEEESNVVALEVDLPGSLQHQTATPAREVTTATDSKTSTAHKDLNKKLFEGDIALLLGKLNIKQGDAVVTADKLIYSGGDQVETLRNADIQSVAEAKQGLTKKVVLTLVSGQTIDIQPVNHKGFLEAMQVLIGEREVGELTPAPKLSEVKNWSAWLAAFGPLIASNLISLIWGLPPYWSWMKTLVMLVVLILWVFIFLRIDAQMLQKQGYSFSELALDQPQSPTYLFKRAKVFGHNPAYAIVWCIALAIAVYSFVM
jgi:uncharacterized protein